MGLDIVYDQQPVIWLPYRVLSASGFSAGLVLGMLFGRGGLYATELQNIYPSLHLPLNIKVKQGSYFSSGKTDNK